MKANLSHIHKLFYRITLLIILVVSFKTAHAQKFDEYEVKAAFLFNFAKFIEWPDNAFKNASEPITLAVLGNNPFGKNLENIVRGRTIKGRQILIKYFENINDMEPCHILFISSSEKTFIKTIFNQLKKTYTLTVGDNTEEFCQLGGMINFSKRQIKYGFEINNKAAKRANIKISSKLLALAKRVEEYDKNTK